MGHNGAGKSTLLRCLSGAERPNSGGLTIGTEDVSFSSPADAMAVGIACDYQELSLVDCLTVSQNVFLGSEETKSGLLCKRQMDEATRVLCVFKSGSCDGVEYYPRGIGAGNLRSLAWGNEPAKKPSMIKEVRLDV